DQVQGITWNEFKDQCLARNPVLRSDGYVFRANKTYILPENAAGALYTRTTVTDATGGYTFGDVPKPGNYALSVQCAGYQPFQERLDLQTDTTRNITLTPSASPQPTPQGFVRVVGSEFMLNDQRLRFIGMNIRGLVHYGDGALFPVSNPGHQDIQLNAAREIGCRVVRVFLANRHRTTEEVANRFAQVLAKIEAHNLYVIPAFTDFYDNTGCNPRGDERFYQQDSWNNSTLNYDFFAGGYRENYLPFVENIVQRFRDHKRVFAWELGNELKAWDANNPALPELFIQFATTISNRIRQLDSNHLITTGVISARCAGCNAEQAARLYRLPNLNFLTSHNYDGDDLENDAPTAQQVGKPFIIEEAGFKEGDRAQRVNQDLQKWTARGARGYLQWGLMASNEDMGDGDRTYGMDHAFHGGDWQRLVDAYRYWAGQINA
ncbi:MAG: carboxypeptidase regulatory-like domain-containing protein, partial [Chloroflexota bacterium]